MNLKQFTIRLSPLVCSALIVLSASKQVDAQGDRQRATNKQNFSKELLASGSLIDTDALDAAEDQFFDSMDIDLKAKDLRDQYLENAIRSQKKLAPFMNTQRYRTEVRKELPGAPIGLHCVYGQYTQLTRALHEMGDTLKIIPTDMNAQNACAAFKRGMRQKYSGPEYTGCIREGKMYASNAQYAAALDQFISRQKISAQNPDSLRNVLANEFAKKNFSIESIEPGTIMIVPRSPGSKTKFHAIMYPGIGIKDSVGNFVPTPDGIPMFVAHNMERLDDLFKSWDTRNVFATDIKKIAVAEYTKEFHRIESMSSDGLIAYLSDGVSDLVSSLRPMSRTALLKLARAKYFGHDIPTTQKPYQIAMNAPAFDLPNSFKSQILQKVR